MNKKDICFILNFAPHYREEIFVLISNELNCDFYFGDKTFASIKKIDYTKFKNKIKEVKFIKLIRNFYYLKGQATLSSKGYKYYVITGQPYDISAWILLFMNKLKGNKTFIWNHGWYGDENRFIKIIKKIQLKFVDGFFLYGDYAKNIMIKEGINKDKLHVIYNSLSYNKQLEIRKGLESSTVYKDRFKNDHPTLIFIGRLTSIKKLDLVLKAMKYSFLDQKYFNLVFIGSGIEKERLQKIVEKFKLNSNVWFYGECYEEKIIGELIYNADLCVSPGNVGLTAIHTLTYGTPIITHNNFTNQMPEFEVIEEGITGLFFKEDNADSLKQTIQNWLSDHPVKENDLIQNCYSIIDKYYNPQYQIKLLKSILK